MRRFTPFAVLVLLAGCGQGAEEPAAQSSDSVSAETGDAADMASPEDTAAKAAAETPVETTSVEATSGEEAAAPAETAANEVRAVVSNVAVAPAAFAQCRVCHAIEPGKHGVGPSLAGTFGEKAGTVEGYAFSPAIKNAGLTLDDATLDAYLENPMKMVPGTKMAFAGIKDPAKRKEVIEYLKTL